MGKEKGQARTASGNVGRKQIGKKINVSVERMIKHPLYWK